MAERGIHAVSLREINAAADQKNASSVQYHFGNRGGLIGAVIARHMERIDAERNALLDALDARGRITPHDVVATLVLPLVTLLATPSGRCYLRIIDEMLELPASAGLDAGLRGLNRSLDRAGRLLADALRALPAPLRAARRALCTTFLLRALASRARAIDDVASSRPPLDDAEFAANLIDVLAAGLVVPPSRAALRHARGADRSRVRRRAAATR